MTRILRVCLVFITLIILLAGCATKKPDAEIKTPPDVRSILATLKMRYDLVDTMRSVMNVKIKTYSKKEEEIREYLYYKKPDKLRIDAMGPFNEPRVVALAVAKSLQIYFVAENELINAELSDESIKRIFDVDLRISDIHSSIFANPFLDGNVNKLNLEIKGSEYLIRRPSTRNGYTEEITISANGEPVATRWCIMDENGELVQEATFSKYKEVGGILRPLKAVIYRPDDQTMLTIESVNPEINVEIADRAFELKVPKSVTIYKLSEPKGNDESEAKE